MSTTMSEDRGKALAEWGMEAAAKLNLDILQRHGRRPGEDEVPAAPQTVSVQPN